MVDHYAFGDKRLENNEASVHYYWSTHEFLEDGTLFMRTSVYGPGFHSSGKFRVAPDDPDFEFWLWLINDKKPMRGIGEKQYAKVHGNELEALRQEYRSCLNVVVEDGSTRSKDQGF